jgi:hypothetical protein
MRARALTRDMFVSIDKTVEKIGRDAEQTD